MSTLKYHASKGIQWSAVSTLVSALLQLVQLTILARLLHVHDFGLVTLILVVLSVLQGFADAGIGNALIHYQNITERQLSTLYWLSWLVGILGCSILVIAAPYLAEFYQAEELARAIQWVSLVLLIAPIGQQFQAMMQKDFRFMELAGIEIAAALVGTTLACCAAYAGQTSFSIVWGLLAASSLKSCLLAWKGYQRWRPRWQFHLDDIRPFLHFGGYQMGERFLNLLYMNIDKLLIGKLLGTEALGLYSVAAQLMNKPFAALCSAVSRVSFPLFARVQNDDKKISRGYLFVVTALAMVSIPLYLGMACVADSLVQLLFGEKWQASAEILKILSLLGILYCLGNPLGSVLLAKGRADIAFWMNVYGLLIYIVALWLGSKFDVVGIAWALLLSTTFFLMPIDFWLRGRLSGMLARDYWRAVVPFFAAGCLMMGLLKLVDEFVFSNRISILNMGYLVLLGAVSYAALIWSLQRRFLLELVNLIKGNH